MVSLISKLSKPSKPLGLFTFNFIAPYQKENTYDLHGSLLDNVPCTMLIYTRSISFAQFCKFRVLCDH